MAKKTKAVSEMPIAKEKLLDTSDLSKSIRHLILFQILLGIFVIVLIILLLTSSQPNELPQTTVELTNTTIVGTVLPFLL